MMRVSDWPLYHYRGTVLRVVDGDTVEIAVDCGLRISQVRRIRLLGYDAPELYRGETQEAGRSARDALALLLPVGSRVYVATELDRTSFDRLLGRVYVTMGGGDELFDVADLMVAAGHGVPA